MLPVLSIPSWGSTMSRKINLSTVFAGQLVGVREI